MSAAQNRACLPCTACCDGWLAADIHGHVVSAGKPCPHSTPSGCGIYASRPKDPCHKFICSWLVDKSPMPDWMRPDLSGAIVLLAKPWHGERVILAIPAGHTIPERTLDWLKSFAQEHRRPLIFYERIRAEDGSFTGLKRFGFGPPGFRSKVAKMTSEELDATIAMASN